jgi:hypothetical protein
VFAIPMDVREERAPLQQVKTKQLEE